MVITAVRDDEIGRIKVTFPYNTDIIRRIKTIPGRRWHPEEKFWSLPLTEESIASLQSTFQKDGLDIDTSLKGRGGLKGGTPKGVPAVSKNGHYLFSEIFPVVTSNLPGLSAYRMDTTGQNDNVIGGKLSYRLRREFGGHWVWVNGRLVTDSPKDPAKLMSVIQKLWKEQPDVFRDLRDIELDPGWHPNPYAQAIFVSNGLFADIEQDIRAILSQKTQDIGEARIERAYSIRGWLIQGKPSVSISVSSRLLYKKDLKFYTDRLINHDDIVGLWVADKTSTFKGEIMEVVGKVSEHRERLLALTQREEMRDIIEKASEDELVVRVGRQQYEYVASALGIILRMEDFSRFGIKANLATKAMRIEPRIRLRIVKELAHLAKSRGLVGEAYNSKDYEDMFLSSSRVGFNPKVKLGGNKTIRFEEKNSLLWELKNNGLYRVASKFETGPMNIGIVNALGADAIRPFLSKLQKEMEALGFSVRYIGEEEIQSTTRVDIEAAIEKLQQENPDILLAFFPDEMDDSEDWGAYHNMKSLTISRGIMSQLVYQSTLDKSYAMGNVVLGVMGKTGNIPYVLDEPLPYADMIVGIDIARERKRRLAGSINATAITRIYFSNGEFLKYHIHDAPLEGETIPDNVLEALFPLKDFKGKRVVVHRDGFFRGGEKKGLREWADKIGAEFYLVEVIKTGTPRLYGAKNDDIVQPVKGSALKVSDSEALLVSSLPPFANATPQPLRIRTESPFAIEQAVHSILSLTLLHYGSLRQPRLPVTIHYSDKIAYLALRGIKPKDLEGSQLFWL